MLGKPTYEELEQRVKELEKEAVLRKQAKKALKTSKEFTENLLETANTLIIVLNSDAAVTTFNRYAEKLTGYKKAEVIGRNWFDLFIPERDKEAIPKVFKKALKKMPAVSQYENSIVLKNSEERLISWSNNVLRDSSGNINGVLSIGMDITASKHAEKTLRIYEHIISTTNDNMSFLNRDYVYQAVSDAYLKFHHKSRREIIGHCVVDLLGSDIFEQFVKERLDRCLAGEEIHYQHWFDFPGSGRRYMDVAYYPYTEEDGAISGVVVSSHDITRFKQMEDALAESEKRFRTVADFTYDWEYWVDPAGNFIYVSPSCERITGYGADEFLRNPDLLKSIAHPDDRSKVVAHKHTALKTGKVLPIDFRIITRSGEKRWIRHVCQAVYSDDGRYLGQRGSNRDITRLKQAEKKQRQMETRLRQTQKMEAICTLAGGIAHQFNNALYAITGNIDLLEMDLQGNEKAAAYIGRIKTLVRHAIGSAIHMGIDLPGDLLNVDADPTQIQMVLSAVLANASEAMEGKGCIRVACRKVVIRDDTVRDFPGLKPGSYACLTVTDDGHGMDEKTKSRIFEPFFTTRFEGRGLGMAAAYGIIRNHDGGISVDSKLGRGTTVKIYLPAIENFREGLPAVKPPAGEEAKPKLKPEWIKGTGTILVIDDEEMVMNVCRLILERLGYRVLEAKTGKEAIDVVNTFDGDIDLAMLDILMPDMNGNIIYPFLKKARPDLKVLVFSGYAIDGPVREILDAGAEDFIQKPFTIAELSKKLKKML